MASDSAEPNDTPSTAQPLTPGQVGQYLVGANDPADYFTLLVKVDTRYTCETETTAVDTELFIQNWQGEVLYYSDDREIGRIDSRITWVAPREQTVIIGVRARGNTYGSYALRCEASAPATPTTIPVVNTPHPVTVTSPATNTPRPVVVTPTQPMGDATLTATRIDSLQLPTLTPTHHLTPTTTPDLRVFLPVRPLGIVKTPHSVERTVVSLHIYYDANNDRKPSPNEGVPNVSVVVVNGNGQLIQQAFTSSQGDVHLTVPPEAQRVVVPFVSGWSETLRQGATSSNTFQIGLQAVEIPVFIPVQKITHTEDE